MENAKEYNAIYVQNVIKLSHLKDDIVDLFHQYLKTTFTIDLP